MKMALPPFILTLQVHNTGNHTRVDKVFCTEQLMNTVIKCKTDNVARPVKTDHYPIITQFNIYTTRTAWEPRRNFRLMNWTKLVKTIRENLTNIPPPTEIKNTQEFNTALKNLNGAIQDAIEKHVKLTKPSPYSKRWWMTELTNEKKKMQQLGGKSKYHRLNPQHPIHKMY